MIVSGTSSDEYIHIQGTPASVWVVTHDMGGYPSVTVVDSANTQVEGDVVYDTSNQVTITFSSAFAGKAYFR